MEALESLEVDWDDNCRSRWNMVDPTLTLESLPNLPTSIQHDSTFVGVPSLCLNKA